MDSAALVIGAGVSGLTTAICLAEAGWSVRVLARDLPHDTTSEVAGALWGPSFQEPVAKITAWTDRSLADFTALAEDPASGVRMARTLTVGTLPRVTRLRRPARSPSCARATPPTCRPASQAVSTRSCRSPTCRATSTT